MVKIMKQDLPSGEDIWQLVRDFAQRAKEEHVPIYTLERHVTNFITEVESDRIWRKSDRGQSNASHPVTRFQVVGLWRSLTDPKSSGPWALSFTRALMYAALHDEYLIHNGNGILALRSDVQPKQIGRAEASAGSPRNGSSGDLVSDLSRLMKRKSLTKTERKRLLAARLGQGGFRQDLISYWQGCSVTGCRQDRLLRASHIKPWSKSTDAERLDYHNGLLLVPNLDTAFDQGFITFDRNGMILISSRLDERDAKTLGIEDGMRINPREKLTGEHRRYLEYHRKKHGFRV
jgi:hypothetical protein